MAERIIVRKVEPGLWQWRFVTGQHQWLSESFYTGDINLLKESVEGHACWLVLDGREVVTRAVTVDVKDRKLLAKLVPFELEEDVVTPVDDLMFAYGPIVEKQVRTSYTRLDEAVEAIHELEEIGAEVQHVICDYLELDCGEGWLLLLDEGSLFFRNPEGDGFRIEDDNAAIYIAALFAESTPTKLHLVADDEESLNALRGMLPAEVEDNDAIDIYEQEGGFWDVLTLDAKPQLDFRTGPLARKLPFGEWWQQWKIPAIAAAAAFVIAIGTTWAELQQAKVDSRQLFADRDAIFRQVVPSGSITDPVRQLQAKLVKKETTEPSNLVFLMSKVAPKIRDSGDLKMTSFRYTQSNGALNFNVEAKSFAVLESLRAELSQLGLTAEIKSAKAIEGDQQQAQIQVTES